jgi:alpha/beta hydrolase family protein DUF900
MRLVRASYSALRHWPDLLRIGNLQNSNPQRCDDTIFVSTNRSGSSPNYNRNKGPLTYGTACFNFAEPQRNSFFDGMEGPLQWERGQAGQLSLNQWLSNISDQVNSAACQDLMRPTDSVIVYLHGFANGFSDALCRAAEIKHRARFEGAMVLFSWPASPTIKVTNVLSAIPEYWHDTNAANNSIDDLLALLSA